MESVKTAPILTPSTVTVDGGAAATTTEDEENAAAAADDAVAEMAERLTIGTDDNANTSEPVDLGAEGDVYSCKDCRTHLGLAADIISKDFHGKNGKAYLFDKVANVNVGAKEDRMMITGMHTVSDIFCVRCGAIVGWKYEAAHERAQRYKEGKFILERYMLVGPDNGMDNSASSDLVCPVESGLEAARILMPSAVSVDGEAAATATEDEENAAAAADAIAEMAKHLTIGTDDNANTSGPVDLVAAEGDEVYSCKDCRTHLGLATDIISKGFHSKNGKAYLFDKVVNVNVGPKEDRMMVTGMHTISDIFCVGCGAIVGWKYEAAHERSQRYKEGKFILERYMLVGPDGSPYSDCK